MLLLLTYKYDNLQTLTVHIYHVMIIVTDGFSKKSFFVVKIIFIS